MLQFTLNERLEELNRRRQEQDPPLPPLTWTDVARELGVTRQMVATLAGNTRLIATSTRVIEGLCRFFRCEPRDILRLHPAAEVEYPTRINELYGAEEQRRFRDPEVRAEMGLPPLRRTRRRRPRR